jgi:hypothetical protein
MPGTSGVTGTPAKTASSRRPAARKPAQIKPIVLSGRGKRATPKFALAGGVTIFTMSHGGSSNWAPELLNATSGETVELLANDIGKWKGSRVIGVDAGRYLIQVEADGAWMITITQPRPATGSAPPKTFTGTGTRAIGPLQLPGKLVTFTMRHHGSSNFAVILRDSEGQEVELLANEIGNFSGSKAIPADRGIYWLDLEADGTWTVSMSAG